MRALIIANGRAPSEQLYSLAKERADIIIATDAAAERFWADFAIGDFDSLGATLKNPSAKKILRASQNSCDLAKAFKFAYACGASSIDIIGADGLREDHAIANFALFMQFASISKSAKNQPLSVAMHSDFGSFYRINSGEKFLLNPGAQVSIFARFSSDMISSSGLKYPLKNMKITTLNAATLNENLGEFSLQILRANQLAGWAVVYLSSLPLQARLNLKAH